ncbi:hypothetical protein BT96DRAFT_1006661 [Gymnopus androsaceus JB14]|uniref:Uncharacterized protein n=1 Tax=Gymnopus androsaceus JB14 TaxID=1447944 RepID=A0A6A4GJG0_9AGAR|nr:hypothetical protein BT96DRAFT_1006661 [Gymnopus androsaceus JB14]
MAISNHWPQGVAFGQTGVKGPELWTFGWEDGMIYVLSVEGKVLKTKTTGTIIGHAVVNTNEDAIKIKKCDIHDIIYTGFKDWTIEVAGTPLILVGRSGENIGQTEIQVWEKLAMQLLDKPMKKAAWEEGRWLVLVILSGLFVLENVLVGPEHLPHRLI